MQTPGIPPTDPAHFDAWDHAPCPDCGYENARCACPKTVANPSTVDKVERRALAEAVLQAIKDREASSPTSTPAPPVQEMSAAEFIATYPPIYYAEDWAAVAVHPDFLAGGDWGWDMDDLCESVAEHGITDPVEIEAGEVSEGHHRVVAALTVNKPVRFRVWSLDD